MGATGPFPANPMTASRHRPLVLGIEALAVQVWRVTFTGSWGVPAVGYLYQVGPALASGYEL